MLTKEFESKVIDKALAFYRECLANPNHVVTFTNAPKYSPYATKEIDRVCGMCSVISGYAESYLGFILSTDYETLFKSYFKDFWFFKPYKDLVFWFRNGNIYPRISVLTQLQVLYDGRRNWIK